MQLCSHEPSHRLAAPRAQWDGGNLTWTSHTHDCWSEEWEADSASDHSHYGAVLLATLLGDHPSKPLEYNHCCWSHSTRCREDNRGKCTMLNLAHPLLIHPSLFPLMSLVVGTWGHWPVAGRMRVVYPYIKKCVLALSPQKPIARMSSLELSSVFVELSERVSPVRGCSSSSVFT